MNTEQLLIDRWRGLNSVQQQEVLDFVEFIAQKSQLEDRSLIRQRRVKQWLDWASDNPDRSSRLPDEAVSRDSIYNED